MKARIILSAADFSQNNIGRIVELSDFTKKVLEKQTQYNEDSDEAQALDTFLNTLADNGFIGGDSPLLDDLFIPGLAASHSQLLYNLAVLDENGYPTNSMTDDETNAAVNKQTYRVVESGGKIVALQRYTDSSMVQADVNAQARMTNHSFSKRNTNNQAYNSFSIILYLHSETSGNQVLFTNGGGTLKATNTYESFVSGNTTLVSVPFESAGKFNVFGYDKDSVKMHATLDGVTTLGSAGTSPIYSTGTSQNVFELAAFNYSNRAEFSFIAIGAGLTSMQESALKSYVETFLTAINATR